MRLRSRGPEVTRLQRCLLAAGYALPRFGADGVYGAETRTAVEHWASDRGWAGRLGEELPIALVHAIYGIAEGVDISGWQGLIDWAAARRAGCRFVWVKMSEGLSIKRSAEVHVARAAGHVFCGGYHFARIESKPEKQAQLALQRQTDLGLPRLALDLEDWSGRGVVDWLRRFLAALPEPPVLYTQPSYWRHKLRESREFGALPLWHAGGWSGPGLPCHLDAPKNMTPPWDCVTFWQVAGSRGRVPWYKGAIDRDVWLGSEQALRAWWG